ncbi:TPA: hypothetical protein N0F65_012315 [Lagenidium giganteum]|uniref:Cell division protein FtsZ n=1 Tax=Lagenidium giganteum TaxID=4803 RepID=A0AAV2YSH1_9STRA|nr:TPA: hypothetical protein N0F65_012315 [Lagenidium giganteum]
MGNSVTLHSACKRGDLRSVRRLLKTCTEAELERKDDAGRTPLLLAVAAMRQRDDEDDDDDDDDEFNSNFSDDDEVEDKDGGNAHRAGQTAGGDDEPEEVEEVNDDLDLDFVSKEAEVLHLLIKKHVNLDHRDDNGWTALHHACFVQSPVAIKMLVHAGAHPTRDNFGLLPQDLLQRDLGGDWAAEAQEMRDTLDQMTDKTAYSIKLFAFRPSGVVQLDMGAQVEKGSLVTGTCFIRDPFLEFEAPETHSTKDYIQMLLSNEGSPDIEIGSYHHVPAGSHGRITISTQNVPSSTMIRFVYVKSDINAMARDVVASGCNALVQSSVGEIFQYELYLYERVVEVESIPEFEFIDQPLIVLKRIGIVQPNEEIDWIEVRPDNHIVAVNDIRIDTMDFTEAVRVLQENNGKKCTKLLMQNYSACGDFIPEKILGVGVVGKYAFLQSADEEETDQNGMPVAPVVHGTLHDFIHQPANDNDSTSDAATSTPPGNPNDPPPVPISIVSEVQQGSKAASGGCDDPASVEHEGKMSAPSPIEAVMPLHATRELLMQRRVQRHVLGHAQRRAVVTASATDSLHLDRKHSSTINGASPQRSFTERRRRPVRHARTAPTKPVAASGAADDAPEKDAKTQQQPRRGVAASKDGRPLITVMGVGGAGSNAVNNMIASQLDGVEFVVANTDCQALGRSLAPRKITLGKQLTKGLGAGSKPQLGKQAAELQREEIEECLADSNMLFITGGMGGGTCTGAAPVVASVARDMGILTVGVVSTPFRSEGPNRTRLANAGVKELAKYVDTLIIVPNQNLLALSTKNTTMLEAFRYADAVLLEGVKGVTDLIVRPGLINLDFADIKTILSNAGRAIMGSGSSSDADRAEKAAEQALINPLLGELPTESALGLLVTIRGGEDMTLFEVDRIMEIIRSRVSEEANIIFGTCYDASLEGSVHVSIIVSGIQTDTISPPVPTQPFAPLEELEKKRKQERQEEQQTPDDSKRAGFFGRLFSL